MKLTHEIITHILYDFGIFSNALSIKNEEFKTSSKIKFEDNGALTERYIYSIKSSIENRQLKVYFIDASSKISEEYSMLIEIDNLPIYGLYFYEDDEGVRSIISTSLDKKSWFNCSVFLQATFLAGMEQLKELKFPWEKNELSEQEKDMVFSFMEHFNADEK